MDPLQPGDLATVVFVGAHAVKRRPVVIVSSAEYHSCRPDAIVAILTSNVSRANTPFDYLLQDWEVAGLRAPSAFRAYLQTDLQSELTRIGRLSERDWTEVRARIQKLFS